MIRKLTLILLVVVQLVTCHQHHLRKGYADDWLNTTESKLSAAAVNDIVSERNNGGGKLSAQDVLGVGDERPPPPHQRQTAL